jgi:enamine deaminase RidA (YjgF/YER057c/UK114 family)
LTALDWPKQVTMTRGPGRAVGLIVALCVAMAAMPERTLSMQERRIVKDTTTPGGMASPAIVAGGFVFVSGLIAAGAAGKLDGTDVRRPGRRWRRSSA